MRMALKCPTPKVPLGSGIQDAQEGKTCRESEEEAFGGGEGSAVAWRRGVTHGEALFWKRSRGDSRVGRGVHGSLGAGEGRYAQRQGGSRARLTPVAGPHATESKDCDKKANYPKMWPPDRFPLLCSSQSSFHCP